jgi:hypothetical protein
MVRKYMRTVLLFSMFIYLDAVVYSQSLLTISSGSSIFISSASIFSMDSLVLIPAADFTIDGLNAETKNVVAAQPVGRPYIQRVFHMINTLQPFTGTIIVFYQDAELNGIPEINLTLNTHNTFWSAFSSGVTRDAVGNFVRTDGLVNVSINEITLANVVAALPIVFSGITPTCNNGKTQLHWATEQEINSGSFSIERSDVSSAWTVIGSLQAAGNSDTRKFYSFSDYLHNSDAFYRIVEYDLDGREMLSPVIYSACPVMQGFSVYPNPVYDILSIQIQTGNPSPLFLEVLDSKGSVVFKYNTNILEGNNRFELNLSRLPAGGYILRTTQNGVNRSQKIIKD